MYSIKFECTIRFVILFEFESDNYVLDNIIIIVDLTQLMIKDNVFTCSNKSLIERF